MAAPINLPRLDPPTNYKNLSDPVVLYLAEITDQFNQAMTQIEELFGNFITSTGIDVGGAGAGPITVPVEGLTPSGFVNATLVSSTNPVTITSVIAGLNSFAITFSADPGASAIIIYQAFTAKPQ